MYFRKFKDKIEFMNAKCLAVTGRVPALEEANTRDVCTAALKHLLPKTPPKTLLLLLPDRRPTSHSQAPGTGI